MRLLFFLLFFNIILSLSAQDISGIVENNESSASYYSIAEDLYKEKNYFEAIYYYESISGSRLFTDSIHVFFKLAECCRLSRIYDMAENNYKLTYEKNPTKYPQLLFNLAEVLMAQAKYQEAILTYQKFLSTNSNKTKYIEKAKIDIEGCKLALNPSTINTKISSSPLVIKGRRRPSYYGAFLTDTTIWFTSSVQIQKKKSTDYKEVQAQYNYYYVDRLFSASINKQGECENGKTVENLLYSMNSNYLPPVFSLDNKTIYMSICNKKTNQCYITFSRNFTPGGEISPEEMDDPINDGIYSSKDQYIVRIKDKDVMFFSSNRKSGNGGYDLYYCVLDQTGITKEVINLGNNINTKYDEISPFYDTINNILYFSSNGHIGYGCNDVYMIEGNPFTGWKSPINMGSPINTSYDDYYFYKKTGKNIPYKAYVSSNREADNHTSDKIYEIKRKTEIKKITINIYNSFNKQAFNGSRILIKNSLSNVKTDTLLNGNSFVYSAATESYLEISIQKSLFDTYNTNVFVNEDTILTIYLTKPLIKINGTILDSATKKPLIAKIKYIEKFTNKLLDSVITDEQGKYEITVQSDKNWFNHVTCKGYMIRIKDLNVTFDELNSVSLTRNYELLPIDIGLNAEMGNIEFEFGKAKLKESSYPELRRIARFIIDNPGVTLEISGHTDNKGSRAVNEKISRLRAQAIVDYMLTQNIQQKNLVAIGYAFDKPIATNDTDEGRAKNRRVEFKIIEK